MVDGELHPSGKPPRQKKRNKVVAPTPEWYSPNAGDTYLPFLILSALHAEVYSRLCQIWLAKSYSLWLLKPVTFNDTKDVLPPSDGKELVVRSPCRCEGP